MTRNQKIALGCGGAGCLGLIVVAIAGGLIYYFGMRSFTRSRSDDFNFNSNRSTNINSSAKESDDDDSSPSSSSASTSRSAASMSEDEKHRLFQAASGTGDGELVRRVLVKIGLMNEDFTPGDDYQSFMAEHISWGANNYEFIMSVNTPEKARAYVNEHFPD